LSGRRGDSWTWVLSSGVSVLRFRGELLKREDEEACHTTGATYTYNIHSQMAGGLCGYA
jgi:hypothetical protein